jgi:hypothetical protein
VATPNYSYEKRQKELAKKRKKEEKLKRKAEGKPDDAADDGTDARTSRAMRPPGCPSGPRTLSKPSNLNVPE